MSSGSPEPELGGRSLAWALWLVALLPLAYVLSVGPAAAIDHRSGGRFREPIRAAYAPLIWLHDNTPMRKPLEWYIELWGVK